MVYISKRELSKQRLQRIRQRGGAFSDYLPMIKKVASVGLPILAAAAPVLGSWFMNRNKKKGEHGPELPPAMMPLPDRALAMARRVLHDPTELMGMANDYISQAPEHLRPFLKMGADKAQDVYRSKLKAKVEPYRAKAIKIDKATFPEWSDQDLAFAKQQQQDTFGGNGDWGTGKGLNKKARKQLKSLVTGSSLIRY